MPQPPIAKRVPVTRVLHGSETVDDYAWLRHRDDPDTIAYLTAENEHTVGVLSHLEEVQERIFDEIRSRVQETDLSAPAKRDDWWYASRTEEGSQYPIFVRMAGGPDREPQTLLDVNALADGHEFMRVGVFSVSPDHRLAAYSTDTSGNERYLLKIRDLESGEDLPDEIPDTSYSFAWAVDGSHVFYTTLDAAHRPWRVWRHELGTDPATDAVVYEETDERMYLSVGTTQDDAYVVISAGSQVTADARYLDATDPTGEFRPVVPRKHGVEYHVDHKDGRWLVVTNDEAIDGRLLSVSVDDPDDVVELIESEDGRKLATVLALAGHTVVAGRRGGLTNLHVIPDDGPPFEIGFDEAVYTVGLGRNLEYDTETLRISYTSLVTPPRVIDVDLVNGTQTLVKETPVLGGYDPDDYISERRWATAEDGTPIPISMVRRRTVDLSTPTATLLYGYGSYEITLDPWFSPARLSLLDRGAVFALAHVRGGGEMGRSWYERGKLSEKANTFTDFIACAEYLIAENVTTPDLLAIRGGSAGGLLMGACVNLRPDLFRAVVAEVPFVDVINTMLDETLPLTVIEWEEWGNPGDEEQFGWMSAYAPYENVRDDVEYPAMLVTAGLNDPRVSYWEPAKWVAKMRATARSRGPLLLKTEMGAGHAGPSGRYDAWRDEAFVLAFVLDQLGAV